MCTVVVSVDPGRWAPVLLVGVRDELSTRPTRGPGEHWPDSPGVYGGVDLRAGGTWLAAAPGLPRVAALLNGHGTPAHHDRRISRGGIPLHAIREGGPPDGDLSRYDPFHLVLGDLDGVRLWSWDGTRLSQDKLPEGTHVMVNSGWARLPGDPRADHFGPLFAAAPAPLADLGAEPGEFWGEWAGLASGAGLPFGDPRAMVVRHEMSGGLVYASLSVTMVALGSDGTRYDFRVLGDDPGPWERVLPRPGLG
ncbi:NRDE family protein [Sinosporangium siamense]|uniref:NRDE family protein n=1 Tax=Sinosporangium siamense TaxID=1367973 RepID=A0A919RJ97_9ACTN|nr:NRDE family protein [Sinosporangium siamense]GII93845.1 hypothetical protein Ssi02_40760 [Sinosporangium siamense]